MADRVQKIIAHSGYCSRRKAEELIIAGKVTVNGKMIEIGTTATDKDIIKILGKQIKRESPLYYVFNKPKNVLCASSDIGDKRLVVDYFPRSERLFSVGRLDYNSSGLLLMTNDGDFANRIMHPRYEIDKTYRITADKKVRSDDLDMLREGVMLRDGKTSPAKVEIVGNKQLDITVHEGKNLIIKRMFKKLGYNVKELHRIRIGSLILGKLRPGSYRTLKFHEKKKLLK